VSSLRKEFAVVLGVESRDRRRIDFRMVQVCLHSGVPSPLHMEKSSSTRRMAPGVVTGRMRAGSADRFAKLRLQPLGTKTKDPAGQVRSTPSSVNTIVPSRT
jgi:hypothetical protein